MSDRPSDPDEPRGEPTRAPSLMPVPFAGPRRMDHPDPADLPPPEVKVATQWRVFCDGGEGALGHPRVFYSIPHDTGWADCGYCDARFVHESKLGAYRAALQPSRRVDASDHPQPADLSTPVLGSQPGGTTGTPFGNKDGGPEASR